MRRFGFVSLSVCVFFSVGCRTDGVEIQPSESYIKDETPPADMPAREAAIRCREGNDEEVYIERVSDGARLGPSVTRRDCDSVVAHSREGTFCLKLGEFWQPASVAQGHGFGMPLRLETCLGATEAAHSGVVCGVVTRASGGQVQKIWKAFNVQLAHAIGRYPVTRDDCLESTQHSRNGVVCSHTGVDADGRPGYKPSNIQRPEDQGFMGSSAWLDYCKIATRHSRPDRVCANGNGGSGNHNYWYEHSISRQQIVSGGRRGSVYVCSGVNQN